MSFHHGPRQKEYLKWKLQQLRNMGFETSYREMVETRRDKKNDRYDGRTYLGIHGQTKANRLFTEARLKAYPNGKKEYNAQWVNLDTLDEFALAIWWMDDGSLSFSKQSKTVAGQLHVCASYQECQLVKAALDVILGEEVKVHRRRELYHIYLPHEAFRMLMRKTAHWIHPDMLYKCSILMGEDGNPIIPNSAGHLKEMTYLR